MGLTATPRGVTTPSGLRITVDDPSQVALARRAAADLATVSGFDGEDRSRVELAATELATNLFAHAGGGTLIVQPERGGGPPGLLLLALDHGPGFRNVAAALRDGFSTAGTPGNGLGAIQRTADHLDVYSVPARGSVVAARFGPGPSTQAGARRSLRWTALSVPRAGEDANGDLVVVTSARDPFRVTLIDGVGHGPAAATGSGTGARALLGRPEAGPADLVDALGVTLRGTRGAVAASAQVHLAARVLTYAAIGDVCGSLVGPERSTGLVTLDGTVGLTRRWARPHVEPWSERSLLVMHTDGIADRWSLDDHPGLSLRDPALICGVLMRDYATRADDATVLVVREQVQPAP